MGKQDPLPTIGEALDHISAWEEDRRLSSMHESLVFLRRELRSGKKLSGQRAKIYTRVQRLATQIDREDRWVMKERDRAAMELAVTLLPNRYSSYGKRDPNKMVKEAIQAYREGRDIPRKGVNAVKRYLADEILEMRKPKFKTGDLIKAEISSSKWDGWNTVGATEEKYGIVMSGPHVSEGKFGYKVLIEDELFVLKSNALSRV